MGGGGPVTGAGVTNIVMYTNSDGLFNLAAIVKSEDGKASLSIAKGVLARTKEDSALKSIKIVPIDSPAAAPAGNNMIGLAYEITPEGATFTPTVALTLLYDATKLPNNTDLDGLVVMVYNTATSTWDPLKSVVNKTDGSVSTDIGHFSVYAIMGKTAAPPTTTVAAVPTKPPASPTTQPAPTATPTPTPTPMSIQTPSPTPAATTEPAPKSTPGPSIALIIAIVAAVVVFGLIGFFVAKARRSKA